MAAGLGFEPRLTDSKSAVLPLDDPALLSHRSLLLPVAQLLGAYTSSKIIPWRAGAIKRMRLFILD
jgi:hypothetical protein